MTNEDQARRLALARRHVAEAERRVLDQYRHVRELETTGASTAFARMLLEAFENNLATLREHLEVNRLAHGDPWEHLEVTLQFSTRTSSRKSRDEQDASGYF